MKISKLIAFLSFALIAGTAEVWFVNRPEEPDAGDTGGGDDAATGHILETGGQRNADDYLESENGAFRLVFQGDGNLVLRNTATRRALWSTKTGNRGGTRLRLQGDGNLVLRADSGVALWSSRTGGSGADRAVLNHDGSFALYDGRRRVWVVNRP